MTTQIKRRVETLEKKAKKLSEADRNRQWLGISLPDNMALYTGVHHCNIQLNISSTDVERGYGRRVEKRLYIMLPYEKCSRCGYHSLWNPDDRESRCSRHTITRGWDKVFSYDFDSCVPLEKAFQQFLDKQPDREWMPTVYHSVQRAE